MSFEISGKLIEVEKTVTISDTFQKREFIVEVANDSNNLWVDYIRFQLTQSRCDLIDSYKVNDTITVSFNIRGRKWEKDGKISYFTNLEAWRIQPTAKSTKENTSNDTNEFKDASQENISEDFKDSNDSDDLPF